MKWVLSARVGSCSHGAAWRDFPFTAQGSAQMMVDHARERRNMVYRSRNDRSSGNLKESLCQPHVVSDIERVCLLSAITGASVACCAGGEVLQVLWGWAEMFWLGGAYSNASVDLRNTPA